MATSNVELRVDARQAVTALQQVNTASGQASAATEKLKNSATGAGTALTNTGNSANRAVSGVNALVGSISKLATAYIGLRTAQQAVQAGIQRNESERRLTFLARGYNEVAQAQASATRAGKQFGLSATESNQQFAQLYGRLRPLNVSLADIESTFVGFNTAAKISGATSAESAGAFLQLTQALGSGVLRGQELNSVLEQAPGLVVALTRELGRPISEIRKLAEEGQITSDVVIRALKRAATDGADQLSEAMQGPAQQVKNLQNAFEDLQVAATDDLLPAIIEAIKGLKELLVSLGPVIRGLGGIAKQTLGTIADLINAATKPRAFAAAQAIRGGRLPLAGLGGMTGAEELFKGTSGAGGVGLTGLKKEAADLAKMRRQPVSTVLLELMQARLARMEGTAPTAGGSGNGAGMISGGDGLTAKERRKREREAERARKQAEKNAQMVAESGRALDVSRQDFVIQQRLVTAQQSKNDALVKTREAQQALLAINAKGAEILANKEIPAQAKISQIEALRYEAKKVSLQLAYDLANLEEEQRKKIEEQTKLGKDRQQSLTDEIALLQAKLNGNEAEKILQQQLRDITKDTAGLDAKAVEDQLRKIQTLKDQVRIQEQIKAVYTDIGMSIKSGITDAIQGAIDGTKTLGDVANQVLRTIGNKLLDVAVNMALFGEMSGTGTGGGLLGGLFKRANGGSVMAGRSYLVGERGPELFTPGRSGGIAPSGSFGAVNVVVNVDASGGNVQGGGALGAAMGRVVTAAVQAELIKQKRAGGILS